MAYFAIVIAKVAAAAAGVESDRRLGVLALQAC